MSFKLWQDKENKVLDPALFFQTAEKMAEDIDRDGKADRGEKNKSTQLRRFFDELVRLNIQAQAKKEDWVMIKPRVHMIVAKAAYAKGRNLVTQKFVNLIRDGISQVDSLEDLQVFTNFFESFMGFYKSYRKN